MGMLIGAAYLFHCDELRLLADFIGVDEVWDEDGSGWRKVGAAVLSQEQALGEEGVGVRSDDRAIVITLIFVLCTLRGGGIFAQLCSFYFLNVMPNLFVIDLGRIMRDLFWLAVNFCLAEIILLPAENAYGAFVSFERDFIGFGRDFECASVGYKWHITDCVCLQQDFIVGVLVGEEVGVVCGCGQPVAAEDWVIIL